MSSETSILLRVPLATLYTVGFIDSAGGRVTPKGRGKNQRSRSAIAIISQDDLDRIFIRKAWVRHCTTDELCDEIFLSNEEFRPVQFGIDASGNQAPFADALLREAREKRIKLPLSKIAMTTDKDVRIETILQPSATAGRILAQEGMVELRNEWEGFPGSVFKDLLDALAGAIVMLPSRQYKEEVIDEVGQYRQYLRGLHLPEAELERRVALAFPHFGR